MRYVGIGYLMVGSSLGITASGVLTYQARRGASTGSVQQHPVTVLDHGLEQDTAGGSPTAPASVSDRGGLLARFAHLPPNCRPFDAQVWNSIRDLPIYELGLGSPSAPAFQRGARTTLRAVLGGDTSPQRPSLLVFGQTTCQPCMDELPFLGVEAQTHADRIRITEVLLDGDWDTDQAATPYDPGYAARMAASRIRIVAGDGRTYTQFMQRVGEGFTFPAFLYLDVHGEASRICFGAIAIATPEGSVLHQWIDDASFHIDP